MTPDAVDGPLEWVDERTGSTSLLHKTLRYVFPDHWTFLLGEMALYSFVALVGTGIYLTLFFEPSLTEKVWHGPYAPLDGELVSGAYASALDLSFKVPAGLLMRQVHHWAALLFNASILVHLMRIFFTGAYRKPREINYLIGVTMLVLALVEGYAGYSLLDDLISGMGLAIGYSTALSIPLVGGDLASVIWGGEFPGADVFQSRLYIAHVLLIPAVLGGLIGLHLLSIAIPRHTQFPGRGRREGNVVGTPMWPGYALRSLGFLLAVVAVLFLLGGFVQINPIWQWGPYEIYNGSNGAQPDWYLGWLIGALRIMPPLEVQAFGHTLVPNPFLPGIGFPALVFALLYAWPFLERRFTRDESEHHLLVRPRDRPRRTALGAAVLAWVVTVFAAGVTDRVFFAVGISYQGQVWFFRVAFFLVPPIVYVVTRRVCADLRRREVHPLRGVVGTVVRRRADGAFEQVGDGRTPDRGSADAAAVDGVAQPTPASAR